MSNATHLTNVGNGSSEWRTPPELFARLNRIYQFDYDAFASHENALCNTYSTIEGTFRRGGCPHGDGHHNEPCPPYQQIDSLDGLRQDWDRRRVWMNPPYGQGILEAAMAKAAREADNAAIIVALIPANSDTKWWHSYVKPFASIHLLQGRVQFIHPPGECKKGCFNDRISKKTGKVIPGHKPAEPTGGSPGGSAVVVYVPEWLR